MATHSSILVWWIPWADEYIGVQRVKHDRNDLMQHTYTEWWKYFDLVDFGEGSWRPQFSPDHPFRTAALDELNSTHLFETNRSIWRFMNWKGTEAVGYGQKGILLKCSCRQLVRPRRYLPVRTELPPILKENWRRKRQPTPVFLTGESQGQGSLVGCRLWGRTESDTTEAT